MTDEHPNERLVELGGKVGRREVLAGGTMLAGLLAYSSGENGVASASHSPSEPLITLGSEDDPTGYIFADGDDLVFQHEPSGAHFRYDASESQWKFEDDVDFGNNVLDNILRVDTGTIATGEASIGTVSGQGDVFRLTDRRTPGSDTGTIQFTGLSDDTQYKVFYSSVMSTAGNDVVLRLNGDGASTGNYQYWDASATEQTSQNEFLLYTLTAAANFAGTLFITNVRFNAARGIGINHQPQLGNPVDALTDFGREGARDNSESLSSIELIAQDDFAGGDTLVELWERDYSS